MEGLSPEQQAWIRQAAPLAVEDRGGPGRARGGNSGHHEGEAGGQGAGRGM